MEIRYYYTYQIGDTVCQCCKSGIENGKHYGIQLVNGYPAECIYNGQNLTYCNEWETPTMTETKVIQLTNHGSNIFTGQTKINSTRPKTIAPDEPV